MDVVYAYEEAPEGAPSQSIFLAGPSPREENHLNWRLEAVEILEDLDFQGVVFIPLPRDMVWSSDFAKQVEWELKHLDEASRIVFWIPRDVDTLPGFTTNVEFGMYVASGKAVLGFPQGAQHMRYLEYLAHKHGVRVFHVLEDTLNGAMEELEGVEYSDSSDK